jgi:hypothetical protein
MKRILPAALAIVLWVASPAKAALPRAVAAAGALAITFVEGTGALATSGSDAWLDLDRISGRSGRLRRRVGVRIIRNDGGAAWGSSALTARLDAGDGRCSIRIDGRPLPPGIPLLVEAHAAVGSITWHTIEIDVPPSAPEGALTAAITWEASEP